MATKRRNLIKAASLLAGSDRALAEACGVSQPTITRARNAWDKRGIRPTPELAAKIHRATNGAVKKWEMRPDVFDAPSDGEDTGKAEEEERAAA